MQTRVHIKERKSVTLICPECHQETNVYIMARTVEVPCECGIKMMIERHPCVHRYTAYYEKDYSNVN